MDSLAAMHEPPADLVASTLSRIDADADAEVGQESCLTPQLELARSDPGKPVASLRMRQRRRVWDSTALTLSLSAICCLALPALVRMRFEARREQCAYQLSQLGQGLIEYSFRAHDGRFPHIPVDGPAAFAGVVAIRLNDAGLLQDSRWLRCPSLPAPASAFSVTSEQLGGTRVEMPAGLPSFDQLSQLTGQQLSFYRFNSAGDYAYNLGVIEDARPVPPRNSGRSTFGIMADAPTFDGDRENFQAHDGLGINIMFEDGRVQFLPHSFLVEGSFPFALRPVEDQNRSSRVSTELRLQPANEIRLQLLDHPFRNYNGQHQIGLHPQDASLAPSHVAPLGR